MSAIKKRLVEAALESLGKIGDFAGAVPPGNGSRALQVVAGIAQLVQKIREAMARSNDPASPADIDAAVDELVTSLAANDAAIDAAVDAKFPASDFPVLVVPEGGQVEFKGGGDVIAYAGDDGAKWAAAFVAHFPAADEGLMQGWFSNAIETATDVRRERNEHLDQIADIEATPSDPATGETDPADPDAP